VRHSLRCIFLSAKVQTGDERAERARKERITRTEGRKRLMDCAQAPTAKAKGKSVLYMSCLLYADERIRSL
jgi:glucose/arabinose dehydrogenase